MLISALKTSVFKRKLNIFLIFCVAIGGSFYGYNIGAMSGALLFMQKDIASSHIQTSLFVAAFLAGAASVMVITGWLADVIGRKKSLICAASLAVISVILMALASNIYELISGRFMAGLASGMIIVTAPLYISETIPSVLRGRATLAFQLFLTFGILLSTVISLECQRSGNWHSVFLYALIPATLFLLLCFFISESPRWLASRKKANEAFDVLLKTMTKSAAKKIMNTITLRNRPQNADFIKILADKRFFIPLVLVISIAVLNQLTGINSILQYDSVILSIGGMHTKVTALGGSVAITAVNFVVATIAITFIDKIERRKILRIGLIGIICCLILLAYTSFFITNNHVKNTLTIYGLLGFIIFFALAPGALIWALISEILPQKIRSKGMAITLFSSNMAGALLAAIFLPLEKAAGLGGFFILCAITTIIYFIISFFIPDTKGKTLEEIEDNFLRNKGKTK